MLDNLNRFDAYNYAKLNPDVFFQLERNAYTHIEDIYECSSSMPGKLKITVMELPIEFYPETREKITHFRDFISNITTGEDNRLRNLIKEELDKDLFSKVTKTPNKGRLHWIFNSSN